MFNNKKGMAIETFALSVLFAATFLVVILLLINIKNGALDKTNDREKCRASVEMHDLTMVDAKVMVTPEIFQLDCARRNVIIYDDHIEVNGKKASFWDPEQKREVKSFKLDNHIINSVFADELAGCWYQFHRGELAFLKEKDGWLVGKKNICGICSEISFDESAKKATANNQEQPQPFLFEKNNQLFDVKNSFLYNYQVPKKYSKDPRTYFDFLFHKQAICDQDLNFNDAPCNFNYLLFSLASQVYKSGNPGKSLLLNAATLYSLSKYALNPLGFVSEEVAKSFTKDSLIKLSDYLDSLSQLSTDKDYIIFMQVTAVNKLFDDPAYYAWYTERDNFDDATCEQFFT